MGDGGLLSLRQGELSRAIPLLERAVGLCQDAFLILFPQDRSYLEGQQPQRARR